MKMQKLINIQKDLKAPKSQYNAFGKYNYRNCEDILEAVKPLCAREGACLTLSDEIVQIGERYYIQAKAALYDSETGDIINTVTAYARESETKAGMDSSQITGSASSYARKYALNGLFNIDDTKDADSDEKGTPPSKTGNREAKGQASGKQTSAGQSSAQSAEEKLKAAMETEVTIKNVKYKIGTMSQEQLLFVKNNAKVEKYQEAAALVLKYRFQKQMQENDDGELPFKDDETGD